MTSCRQGLRWWEVDVTWYVLKLLQAAGSVRDVRGVPASMVARKARAA